MANDRSVSVLPNPKGGEPLAWTAQIGDVAYSSTIAGRDPTSGELADGPEAQFDVAFQNLRRLAESAGMTLNDVAQLTVVINDSSYRPHINKPWIEMFPNDEDRPARKTNHARLPDGELVNLQERRLIPGPREKLTPAAHECRAMLVVGHERSHLDEVAHRAARQLYHLRHVAERLNCLALGPVCERPRARAGPGDARRVQQASLLVRQRNRVVVPDAAHLEVLSSAADRRGELHLDHASRAQAVRRPSCARLGCHLRGTCRAKRAPSTADGPCP